MADGHTTKSEGQVPTNLRLVLLIEAIAKTGAPVSPVELGKMLDLPKPTVHRLLTTAEAEGLVQRHLDGRSFAPGQRLRRIAANTLSTERIRTERVAVLKKLAEDVGETCNIAIPDREGMQYLERVETHWPLRIQLPIGSEVPFNCTASGKMFLASLRRDKLDRLLTVMSLTSMTEGSITDAEKLREEVDEVRRTGFATDNEEFMKGMAAIAIPVQDNLGRMTCTLSIHAPIQRVHIEGLIDFLPNLTEAGQQLEALLQE